MLPPHLPQSRKIKPNANPLRCSRSNIVAGLDAVETLSKLRVLGRKRERAAKPSLKIIKSVGDVEC